MALAAELEEDEEVLGLARGVYMFAAGLLAVTGHRLIFVHDRITLPGIKRRSWPYADLERIEILAEKSRMRVLAKKRSRFDPPRELNGISPSGRLDALRQALVNWEAARPVVSEKRPAPES